MVDQFTRLRDGDPHFYSGDADLKSKLVRNVINLNQVTLGKIIQYNTNAHHVGDIFRVSKVTPEPEEQTKKPKRKKAKSQK